MKRSLILLIVLALCGAGFFFFYSSDSSFEENYQLVVPLMDGETISPFVASADDFVNIHTMTFVYRGEKELVINGSDNRYKINNDKDLLILSNKDYLKYITPRTSHIVCTVDIDDYIAEALNKIEVPFYLEVFAGCAVKNIDLLNSLPNMTHLKVSLKRISGIKYKLYKDANQGNIDLEPLKALTCPNLYINFDFGIDYKDKIPLFENCKFLEISTANESNYDVISKMDNLKYLYLNIDSEISEDVMSKIKQIPGLTHLRLENWRVRGNRSFSVLYDMDTITHLSINDQSYDGYGNLLKLKNLISLKVRDYYSTTYGNQSGSGLKKLMLLDDQTKNFIEVIREKGLSLDKLRALSAGRYEERKYKDILKGLNKLVYLKFGKNFIKEDLKSISEMKSLEYVDFRDSYFNDSDAECLTQLPKLKDVNLTSTKITNSGVELLSQIPTIKRLNLSITRISKGVLKYISRMKQIEFLNIRSTPIVEGKRYNSWAEINDFINEKMKELSLGETIFKSYIVQTFGILRVPVKGEDLNRFGLKSFDCKGSYTPMRSHVLYLLKGFSEFYDKSFNFHNTRSRDDEDTLSSFIEEKTGEPLILSREEYKAGTLNSYNKEALKKLYEMSKVFPTVSIGENTAMYLYQANFINAVRKRVKDVIKLFKNKEQNKMMLNEYLVQLNENEYGTDAQMAVWKKFFRTNQNDCLDDEEAELLGFLLRRKNDGTLSTILMITLDFLKNYDNEFYQEIERPLSEFIDPE